MAKKIMITVAALCIAVLMCSTAYCEVKKEVPPAKPAEVKMEGTVHVVKDANGVVTSVKLVTTASAYHVVLDAKGLELGKTENGKKVEVEGIVAHKEKDKWVTVKSFKVIEEKPANKK
jgi:hypothetical protein